MTLTTLQNKVYFLTKTNTSSFPSTDLNAAINNAIEHWASVINRCDSRWQWEDNNQTDLPIATGALVSGQKDYSLATSHLTIDRVEVKDTSGNWHRLTPFDQQDLKRDRNQSLTEYRSTTGTPEEYDLLGSSVVLYPTPNYSQSASLKIYFTRGPVTLSSGSDVPGFNSLFHQLIAYRVAYEYAIANGLNTANGFLNAMQLGEQEIADFYGKRNRDERPRLNVSTDSNQ